MASRRMFSQRIINSARFLRMPISARLLYYDLGMRADDDGVVEAYPVAKLCGCTEDDLKVLYAKGFIQILDKEELIAYITDWTEHNTIRADRKIDSIYKDLLIKVVPEARLVEKKQRSDVKPKVVDGQWTDNGQSMDSPRTDIGQPMDGIREDRIGKVNSIYDDEGFVAEKESFSDQSSKVIEAWNALGLSKVTKLVPNTDRYTQLKRRIKDYGVEDILKAIENVKTSDFLMGRVAGRNNRPFNTTFDWFISPNNFPKVLDGNYKTMESVKPKSRNARPGEQHDYNWEDIDKMLIERQKNG